MNDSTTESTITATTQTIDRGLVGSKNWTLVNKPGEAIEWLARPPMPATAPQMNPLIKLAIKGRFNRTATPYRAVRKCQPQ